MTCWRLETSPQFDKVARKLDKRVLRRLKDHLDGVCELEDPRTRRKGLTGELSGYWRYRVGDYRVIVEIRDDTLVIVAVAMGHRSGVYRGQ